MKTEDTEQTTLSASDHAKRRKQGRGGAGLRPGRTPGAPLLGGRRNPAVFPFAPMGHAPTQFDRMETQQWFPLCDILVLLLLCTILASGIVVQVFSIQSDAAKYQCYALVFWHGIGALKQLPEQQCAFITRPDQGVTALSQQSIVREMQQIGLPQALVQAIATQSSTQPYHALPHEYPLLALFIFSLSLLGPVAWYQVIFAFCMALVASAVYLILRAQSRGAALAYACYLAVGGWATALGRFDLIPAALTLLAVISAQRGWWKWAFALLALATMCKFYPLILILPFLIVQRTQEHTKIPIWRRIAPLGIFAAICLALTTVSLFLNIAGTLAPLSYLIARTYPDRVNVSVALTGYQPPRSLPTPVRIFLRVTQRFRSTLAAHHASRHACAPGWTARALLVAMATDAFFHMDSAANATAGHSDGESV